MSFIKNVLYKLNGKHISDVQNEILEYLADQLFSFDEDEIEPPSSTIALCASACGKKLPQVLSSSINVFGTHHACFTDIYNFIINDYNTNSKIYPGFGHPKFKKQDPRTKKVLNKIKKLNYKSANIEKACRFSKKNKLPLNIAGLTTCILMDCGCNIYNIDLFFIMCRSVGLTMIHQKSKIKQIKFSSTYDIIKKYNCSNSERL